MNVVTSVLDAVGVLLVCSALVVLLGVGGALAAGGGLCLLASWIVTHRA